MTFLPFRRTATRPMRTKNLRARPHLQRKFILRGHGYLGFAVCLYDQRTCKSASVLINTLKRYRDSLSLFKGYLEISRLQKQITVTIIIGGKNRKVQRKLHGVDVTRFCFIVFELIVPPCGRNRVQSGV